VKFKGRLEADDEKAVDSGGKKDGTTKVKVQSEKGSIAKVRRETSDPT